MKKPIKREDKTQLDLIRRSAKTSGIGLLLMAILAPIAYFGILGTMIVSGDLVKTLENLTKNPWLFLLGVVMLLMVAALDVAVAFSLKRFFIGAKLEAVNYMSWLRVMYAGVFVGAISFLVIPVIQVLAGLKIEVGDLETSIAAFEAAWDAALILFAGHLILLGWLFYKVGYTPNYLAPFLVVAGLGYLIDSFGGLLIEGYSIEIAAFTFVGEVILLLWLLIKGRKVTPQVASE